MDPVSSDSPGASGGVWRRWPIIAVFLVAAVVGFFLFRRPSENSQASAPPAAGPSESALIVSTVVTLSSKAALIADRYNCMCGECSDLLGACSCMHAAGANEMKAMLNQLVEENKSLEEIDAALVAKYGEDVLTPTARNSPPADGQ